MSVHLTYTEMRYAEALNMGKDAYRLALLRLDRGRNSWQCDRCGKTGTLAGKLIEIQSTRLAGFTVDDALAYEETDHALTGCNGRLEFVASRP